MKLFVYLLTFFSVFGMQANDANFYLANHADKDIHFTVLGANDLMTIKNLELHSPIITTLKPGEAYEEHVSLHGELDDKPPLLYLYPSPQGVQETWRMAVDISRDNIHTVLEYAVGDERIYRLGKGKPVCVEIVPGHEPHKYGHPRTSYYEGLTVRSLCDDRGSAYTKTKDIKRGWGYEVLGQWIPEHKAEFQDFIETIDAFVYTYLRASNIVKYVWRYGIKGIKDIAKVRSLKAKMEKTIGMKL